MVCVCVCGGGWGREEESGSGVRGVEGVAHAVALGRAFELDVDDVAVRHAEHLCHEGRERQVAIRDDHVPRMVRHALDFLRQVLVVANRDVPRIAADAEREAVRFIQHDHAAFEAIENNVDARQRLRRDDELVCLHATLRHAAILAIAIAVVHELRPRDDAAVVKPEERRRVCLCCRGAACANDAE